MCMSVYVRVCVRLRAEDELIDEEDCFDVLGIRAGDTDVDSGEIDTARYPDVARQVVRLVVRWEVVVEGR